MPIMLNAGPLPGRRSLVAVVEFRHITSGASKRGSHVKVISCASKKREAKNLSFVIWYRKNLLSLVFHLDGFVLRAPRRLPLSPPNKNTAFRHKPFITRHKITSFSLLSDAKTIGEERLAVMRFFFLHNKRSDLKGKTGH